MPTNLDASNNKTPTAPVLEMRVPISELDTPLKVGDTGTIMIPVHVVDVSDNMVTLRKIGKIESSDFSEESLEELRKKIGVVEEPEVPFYRKGMEEESGKTVPKVPKRSR